jgi:hypothetical protein
MKSLVFGSGVNDSESPVYRYKNRRLEWICPFYVVWVSMLRRCYSEKHQLTHPTYAGCSVATEWLSFSTFRAWMSTQDWQGNDLDKDILSPGNKVYSPETCVFVDPSLNGFLNDRGHSRGEWPIGVCWHKRNRKFSALCCNPFTGKQDHISYFDCPDAAHEAWRKRKHEHALRYADMQSDPCIAESLRTRFARSPHA